MFCLFICSGRTTRRFFPIGKILRPVLLECVTPLTCYWSLSLIVRDEGELMLVFKVKSSLFQLVILRSRMVWKWNIDFTYGCSPSTCKTGNTFEKKLIIRRLTSFKCSSIFYLLAFDWFMTIRNYAHQWRCWFQSGRLCVPPLIVKKVQMQMMVNGFKA